MEQNRVYIMTGAWVLDLTRSETFERYLQCLNTPPELIQAQVLGEHQLQSRNVIALDESTLIIHKQTAVNDLTERFQLDVEKVTPAKGGDGGLNTVTVSLGDGGSLDGYVVVSTTTAPSGRESVEQVEVRQLTGGGLAHIQEIHLKNVLTDEQCTVRRTWVRVPMTQQDQLLLLNG